MEYTGLPITAAAAAMATAAAAEDAPTVGMGRGMGRGIATVATVATLATLGMGRGRGMGPTVKTKTIAAAPVTDNSSSGDGQPLLPADGAKAQVVDSKLAERAQQNIEPEALADEPNELISNQELDDMESSITVEPPDVVPSNGSASKYLVTPVMSYQLRQFDTPAGPGFNDQVSQLFKKIDTDASGTLDRNEAAKAILFQTGKYLSGRSR